MLNIRKEVRDGTGGRSVYGWMSGHVLGGRAVRREGGGSMKN